LCNGVQSTEWDPGGNLVVQSLDRRARNIPDGENGFHAIALHALPEPTLRGRLPDRRPDGIVVVNYDACMGCRYCEAACPYGARTFLDSIRPYVPKYGLNPYEQLMYAKHQTGVEEKCNFCLERFNQGQEPACVETCPTYARVFGDLDDPNSEVSKLIAQRHGYQLMPELGTNPSVYYLA
jgi:Fe-S-cluster-containing dehydrogenase component